MDRLFPSRQLSYQFNTNNKIRNLNLNYQLSNQYFSH